METKAMTEPIRKAFDASLDITGHERTVTARISTMSVDRDGEVLVPQGCDATEFQKSPTVFYNHNYAMPLGRCEAIARKADSIEATTRFALRPEGHVGEWLADTVFSLFQQKVISGFSVGFVPIEGRHPSRKDRETFGQRVRYVFSKWKLLEYSVAPLPANQDALVLAVSKGIVSPAAAHTLFPDIDLPEPRTKRRVMIVVPKTIDPVETVRREVLRAKGALYA
jgi:HK97 family phage prohead protease